MDQRGKISDNHLAKKLHGLYRPYSTVTTVQQRTLW